ncbi:MAG: membrane protein insertase YidC, partial [Planctomycetota bacterium]|nr:membrane protein insertase YidC [Planctomycetota bacterium]
RMVQRYILAFICSAALMFFWVQMQPPPAEKIDQGAAAELKGGADQPGEKKSAPAELEPGKPGEPAPGEPEKPEAPEAPVEPEKPASTATGIEVKDGGLLKDGKELAGSTGAAGLSIEGDTGFEPVNFQGEDKAPEKNVWKDEGKAGGYTITRVITDTDPSADGIQQLSVELIFKEDGNKPAGARRYRIRGPSFSAQGDRVVVASRVDGEVKSWAFDQAPPKQEGNTEWIALRQFDRLAILSAEDRDEAAVVDAAGVAIETELADGDSEAAYALTFGSSAPAELINYNDNGIGGELFRINRTWEEFVPNRFRVAVDSERGGIAGVTLLDSWTAVEGDKDREEQPLLLERKGGRILLEMGSLTAKAEDDKEEGWSGRWSEKIVKRDDQSREIIFEKTVEFEGKKVQVLKKISPASAGDFEKLLGDAPKYADGRLLHVTIELTSDKTIGSFPFRFYGPCAIASTSGRWVGLDMQFAYGTNYSNKNGAETHIYDPDEIPALEGNKDVAWLTTVNSYFTALMFPRDEKPLNEGVVGLYAEPIAYPVGAVKDEKLKESLRNHKSLQAAFKCNPRLPAKKTQTIEFGLYLGPRFGDFIKEGEQLSLDGANDLGMTSGLIKFFMGILHLLHGITGGWGAAIILLTVLVKICLHPITRKNQRGMMRMGKVMAKIKPEMDALQEKYGADRMKYSQEVQKVWKKHNVNPAKQMLGCLVIFLQMPIWIGIIWSLDFTVELRQASFLWIQDLTMPDMLDRAIMGPQYTIGLLNFWPFYGHLNVLPVLYVILTLVNQSFMQPTSKEPQQAAQQKMMKFMMLFFGVIFYSFPSGFMLYIMTSAALGIAESKLIKAQLAKEDLETEAVATVSAPQEPLYPAKNKSAGQRAAPTSAKKKKNRRRKR